MEATTILKMQLEDQTYLTPAVVVAAVLNSVLLLLRRIMVRK